MPRRGLQAGFLAVVALLTLPVAAHYARLGVQAAEAARAMEATLRDASALQSGGGSLKALQSEAGRSHASLAALDSALRHDPGVWLLSRLPWVGHQIVQGRRLLTAGVALSDAASQAGALLQPVQEQAPAAADGGRPAQFAQAWSGHPAQVGALHADLATAAAALTDVDLRSAPLLRRLLPPRLAAALGDGADLAGLAAIVENGSTLLGANQPTTYLILGLDNIELLPGGGLIAGYGQFTVQNGALSSPKFAAAAEVGYSWLTAHGYFTPAPAPLARTLLEGKSWDLATADWSPTFAAGAEQAAAFVADATGRQSDEVIGVDLDAFTRLVDFVGGVSAPQFGVALPAGSPIERIGELQYEGAPAGSDVNAIHAALAQDLFARIQALPPSRLPSLLVMLSSLANAGHIQVYSTSPALEAAVTALGWGGGMGDTGHDYLALVDGNVRSTKLNLTLQEQLALHVRLAPDGSTVDTASVQYRNDDSAWAAGKDPYVVQRMMCFDVCRPGTLGGVYGDYVRAYVPAGSVPETASINSLPAPLDRSDDVPAVLGLGEYVLVPQAGSSNYVLSYKTDRGLHACGRQQCYTLYLRRQPGTHGLPVKLSWQAADGDDLVTARVNGASVRVSGSSLSLTLDRDQTVELVFAKRPKR